ncbi:MAG: hypothetical protein WC738_06765, partial [Candidatus Omnitrophota bacterium]
MPVAIDIRRSISTAVIILLALTPFFNIGEICGVMTNKPVLSVPILTPIYVKLIKDAFLLIIFALCAINLRKLDRYRLNIFFFMFIPLLLITVLSLILSYKNNHFQILAGLRWVEPLFLAAFLIGNIDDELMSNVAKVASLIFLLSFIVQIYEVSRILPIGLSGLLRRSWWFNGLFMTYHAATLFACATLFFVYFYLKMPLLRMLILCLIPVNILITRSGTGFPTYLLASYTIWAKGRINKITVSLFILASALIIYLSPAMIGRPIICGGTIVRANIFNKSFSEADLFSRNFGKGTNAMVLLSREYKMPDTGRILDSTASGVVVNLGRAGLFLALAAYAVWVLLVLRSKRPDAMVFTLIYSMYAITIPIMEAFPG